MNAESRYRTAAAFRRALEQRLRTEAQTSGIALNRLRKDAAFNRLLTRLHRVAPNAWALKGGLALIAMVGLEVRATKDADANWRASRRELEAALSLVEEIEAGDWFRFEVGDARSLRGEGEQGALRYPIAANLDGRVFEQFSLDINLVDPLDPRPVEQVSLQRNPFELIDEPTLTIPMIAPSQQLAEKLHAYVRRYDDEASSRAKDLFDMLVIARQVELPPAPSLVNVAEQTFQIRGTPWPPRLEEPPTEWVRAWQGFVRDYPLQWTELDAAFVALQHFWKPILTGGIGLSWQPDRWQWV